MLCMHVFQPSQSFFTQHYGPSNLTICIVGDVTPELVRRLAETHFGGWAPTKSRGMLSTFATATLPQLLAGPSREALPRPAVSVLDGLSGWGVPLSKLVSVHMGGLLTCKQGTPRVCRSILVSIHTGSLFTCKQGTPRVCRSTLVLFQLGGLLTCKLEV